MSSPATHLRTLSTLLSIIGAVAACDAEPAPAHQSAIAQSAEMCTTLDFDTTPHGDDIHRGDVVEHTYDDVGVDLRVSRPRRGGRCEAKCEECTSCQAECNDGRRCERACNKCERCAKHRRGLAVAFDTEHAYHDPDLAFEDRGNVLISQEHFSRRDRRRGRVRHPDDDARGAVFELSFHRRTCVQGLILLDLDEGEDPAALRFYGSGDTLIDTRFVEPAGDHTQQLVQLDGPGVCGVTRMEIQLSGSGAVDDIQFCADLGEQMAPEVAVDTDPRDGRVEITLEAREAEVDLGTGALTRVWTYNGGIPGPTIEAEVGDVLTVHFYNSLPEPTTVHWHGVEVPADMDGSNISQTAVPPGGYFRYRFKLRRAATFWYHPHIRSHEQVERGLYGALVVRDPADHCAGLPQSEHVAVLDDVLVDDEGQLADVIPLDDPLANAERQLNGREGNILLVNGTATHDVVHVRRGEPQRLRLVNASNSRMMRVSLSGHTMYRVGGDGGLLESPIEILPIDLVPNPDGGPDISDPDLSRGLILTPGERADVVFTPEADDIALEWHDYARGRHSAFYTPAGTIGIGDADDDGARPFQTLMTFRAHGDAGANPYEPPAHLRDIEPIDVTNAAPLPVMMGHTPPDEHGDVTFFVQMRAGAPLPFDAVTPDDAPTVTVGETRVWEINNMTGGDHNFHPHGFSFQPIEIEYIDMDDPANNAVVPFDRVEIKDTIRVPKRPGARGRSRTVLRAAVTFDDHGRRGRIAAYGKVPGHHRSGGWIFHCHILEHAARGMMSFLQVVE